MHARYDVPLRLVQGYEGSGGKRVGLEIGCGDGVLLYKAMSRGDRIVGIDLAYDSLTHASEQITGRLKRPPQVVNASCYHLPFPHQSFDYVLSIEVIEHLADVDRYLQEIKRVLRPGGMVALTTPHRQESGMLQDPFHVREYTGPELATCLGKHFPKVSVWGMYPAALDRLYFHATGIGPLDKLVCGVFKLLAKWVFNPYIYSIRHAPDHCWAGLVALCTVDC